MTSKEIEFQCQLAYDAKLLELIGKNVGDKVKCSFFVRCGDRKHSYTSSIDGEGTIILDEKGYGVLSDKKYQDSKEVRDYPWSCSNFRTHWEYVTKKIKVVCQIHKTMTREEAKELLPIIQAYVDGKAIQYRSLEGEWEDVSIGNNLSFADNPSEYRIKPEPKYRPFRTKDECWNEMLKHQPFGWVRLKHSELLYQITSVSDFDVILSIYEKSSFPASLIQFEFADGTPFGIKEE